jgi:hypothetical protein
MKTVKVRVAVAVDPSGKWSALGWSGETDKSVMASCVEHLEEGEARYWLEAELPVPEVPVIRAEVTDESNA